MQIKTTNGHIFSYMRKVALARAWWGGHRIVALLENNSTVSFKALTMGPRKPRLAVQPEDVILSQTLETSHLWAVGEPGQQNPAFGTFVNSSKCYSGARCCSRSQGYSCEQSSPNSQPSWAGTQVSLTWRYCVTSKVGSQGWWGPGHGKLCLFAGDVHL
jgi:hypothetical protein